jgi:hypothetical protein
VVPVQPVALNGAGARSLLGWLLKPLRKIVNRGPKRNPRSGTFASPAVLARPGGSAGTTAKLGMLMQKFGSPELTAPRVAWDAWLATHSGAAAVATRQAARLEALVRHARRASPFYAERPAIGWTWTGTRQPLKCGARSVVMAG